MSLTKEPRKGAQTVTGVGLDSSAKHLYNIQWEPSGKKLEPIILHSEDKERVMLIIRAQLVTVP